MAEKQVTVTLETLLTQVTIEPIGAQLYLQGVIKVQETGMVAYEFSENVTSLLDAEDIAAATRLVTRANAWIDSKMP